MYSKDFKFFLIRQINGNYSSNPGLGNQIHFNLLENNKLSQNNRIFSPRLLINNFNSIHSEKELDDLNNQFKHTNNDEKIKYTDLPTLKNNNNINDNNNNEIFKNKTGTKKVNSKHQKPKNKIKTFKRPRGRLKKNKKKVQKQYKYRQDNLRRKVKHLVLRSLVKFLNKKMKILYNGKIGYNILRKEFLMFNKNPKYNSSIEYNKLFLKKTIKEILSQNISTIYNNYKPDFNKKLIERLINEEDNEKRKYFKKIFNLTFVDCLKHFNKTKEIKELDGMECIDDVLEEFNNEKEYKEILYYQLKNFDDIINSKSSRTSKKNETKIESKNNGLTIR